MTIKIHRGTNEIGGICIELNAGKTTVLVDFGMPLVNRLGEIFDFNKFKHLSVSELIDEGVLPDIKEAYAEKADSLKGLLLSHPHPDHYGLMHYLNSEVPVWLGQASHKILELNNIFLRQKNFIKSPNYFKNATTFAVGDFQVTPYLNDHSAFDSYSFLIESEGTKVFYSGDFRGHGRKEKAYRWFLKNPPKNVDYLLIEGTTMGRDAKPLKHEEDIKDELSGIFERSASINYVYTSSQNIDRLVSIYKACLISEKCFVVDIYTANVLDTLSQFAKLPTPLKGYGNLRVLYPYHLTNQMFRRGFGNLAKKFSPFKVTKKEISDNPSTFVVLIRPSMKIEVEKINAKEGNLIYSLWEGYKKQPQTKEFIEWFSKEGFNVVDVHTSGHANAKTLNEYADAINPKTIIPIHTFHKYDYNKLFKQKVLVLNDNETVEL